jgi:lysosomal Pro-X carboxypeptidase
VDGGVPEGYTLGHWDNYVDNYSSLEDTFTLKYYYNDQYFNSTTGGPMLFYCGNEGAIEMFINNTGFITTMAESMSALVVFAEHRYFGDSLPYGDESFTNMEKLKYLSSH